MRAIKLMVILAGFLVINFQALEYTHAGGKRGGHSYGGGNGHGHSYRGGHRGGHRGHSQRRHGYGHRNYGHRNYGYRRYGYRPYYGTSFYFGVSPYTYYNYGYYPRRYKYVEPTTVYVESPPPTVSASVEPSPKKICLQEREYQTKLTIDGQEVEAHGVACLQPDGSWRLNPPESD